MIARQRDQRLASLRSMWHGQTELWFAVKLILGVQFAVCCRNVLFPRCNSALLPYDNIDVTQHSYRVITCHGSSNVSWKPQSQKSIKYEPYKANQKITCICSAVMTEATSCQQRMLSFDTRLDFKCTTKVQL